MGHDRSRLVAATSASPARPCVKVGGRDEVRGGSEAIQIAEASSQASEATGCILRPNPESHNREPGPEMHDSSDGDVS
jgi:hypothetical protein